MAVSLIGYVMASGPLTLNKFSLTVPRPASMAQSDAPPISDQEVTGLTPARPGNIHLWRLIVKYLLLSFSSSADSSEVSSTVILLFR